MKITITLNKNCIDFENIDWYIIQHSSNMFGGISYVDGFGYWLNPKNHQLIKDENRYYTIFAPDTVYTSGKLGDIIYTIKELSKEEEIMYSLSDEEMRIE